MKIDEIEVGDKALVLATDADVDGFETEHWIKFPIGYREYVTQIGEGTLGTYVRVYPPWRIARELGEWRERIEQYWVWDEAGGALPKERAIESIVIADTIDGDEIVFHPCRPKQLFVLPRHGAAAIQIDGDFWAALDWLCTSGELTDPFDERDFEPFDSREEEVRASESPAKTGGAMGESLDDIVRLAKQWLKCHNVRKAAKKELERALKESVKTEADAEVLYEAIILDGIEHHNTGYEITWRVRDKASRLEIATISWQKDDHHQGSSYTPNKPNLSKLREMNST
jgi:hypothetical protein